MSTRATTRRSRVRVRACSARPFLRRADACGPRDPSRFPCKGCRRRSAGCRRRSRWPRVYSGGFAVRLPAFRTFGSGGAMSRGRTVVWAAVVWAAVAPGWTAEKLPPLTQAERDLKEAPGEPSATAVFLVQSSTIHLQNILAQEPSSLITTKVRLKILKDEGKSHGEIVIAHNDAVRLQRFEGRTIAPDGKVIKVDSKGKFKRKLSDRTKRQVSTIAFPTVEIGSILEYEYDLAFDSFLLLEPWYFRDDLPVLQSEVIWEIPYELQSRVWKVPTFGVVIDSETKRRPNWVEARYVAKNLPSTPNEPYGYPFRDQATRMLVVPIAFKNREIDIPLF